MKKRVLVSAFIFLLSSCQQQVTETSLQGNTQGTTYHIKLVLKGLPITVQQIQTEVTKQLTNIDLKLSNYREDSEISRLNAQETTDWLPVSPEIIRMLTIANTVYAKTNGCYDLTVKPLFDLWGFSRHQNRVPAQNEIQQVLAHIGMSQLEIDEKQAKIRKKDPKLKIDLSSIAQGYSVGVLAQRLEALGVKNYMIEIGGEMMVKGHKANGENWRIGIVTPKPDSMEAQKILDIKEQNGIAIMTAGTYRNFFEEKGKSYSHIINPKTGTPVTHHLLSVTVLHENPAWADAWDTALLCVGEKEAARIAEALQLKVLLIYAEGENLHEYISKSFVNEQFF